MDIHIRTFKTVAVQHDMLPNPIYSTNPNAKTCPNASKCPMSQCPVSYTKQWIIVSQRLQSCIWRYPPHTPVPVSRHVFGRTGLHHQSPMESNGAGVMLKDAHNTNNAHNGH